MSWNYRTTRERLTDPDGYQYAIRAVYYDDDGGQINGWSADPQFPTGETPQELAADFVMMKSAFDLPCLDVTDDEAVPIT